MAKQKKAGAVKKTEETPVNQPVNTVHAAKTESSTAQPLTLQLPMLDKLKGKEHYFLMLAIALSCIVVFYDFITGEKVYLYKDIGSDSVNIYFPWLVHISDYVKNNGTPTWSFSQGMGQNIFPLWLGDFFSDIISFLFSREKLPYMLANVEIAKILLSGFVFFKYLSELKLGKFTAAVGAYLFAFCGYIILGGCWTIFSSEAFYVALILYGFERWLNHGKILWFVLGISALAFLQPFFLYPYTLFLAAYILVRYNDVKGDTWSKFPLFIAKTIGLAVVAVAISAYQLFPDLLQYIESPRVGGDASLVDNLKAQPMFGITDSALRFTTTFRAFGSDMLGTGSEFKGWQNYLEAPLFYCGILCLVVFPQAFVGYSKNKKIAWGVFAGVFILPVFFPYFRYIFWAFSGNYFRAYSLVVTLMLLIFSAQGLDHVLKNRKVNLPVLGVTTAFLLFLLFSPATEFEPNINQGMRSSSTLLVILYAGILWALTRENLRATGSVLLVVFCMFEMMFYSYTTINQRDAITGKELTEKVGYNDYTVEAVKYIKDHDKGFYRINKDYQSGPAIHTSFNDAKVQGYFGTMSYHSFNQINYVRFLGIMGVINPKDEFQTRWLKGLWERPLLLSLTSGKYILAKNPEPHLKMFGYDSVGRQGNVDIYKNNYAQPLGVAYDQGLNERTFRALSQGQKDIYLFKGCVIDSGDNEAAAAVKQYDIADTATPTTMELYFQSATALSKKGLNITSFKEDHIIGNIATQTSSMLFLSIPYDEGWKALLNGKEVKIHRVNCGFTGIILPAGSNTVDLKFTPRYMAKGGIISVISILVFIGLLAISRKYANPKTATE